jgi:hypothetical protein
MSPGTRSILVTTCLLVLAGCCMNPFAPCRDDSPAESLCDPMTVDGIFRCFSTAYSFRDTTLYGQLLHPDFVFIYRNYEIGVDVSWGRDDEMRTTYGLFQNAQKLDLIWNNILSVNEDTSGLSTNVVRGFNLTITFNPSDIERIAGYANLVLQRADRSSPWAILQWRDESNF